MLKKGNTKLGSLLMGFSIPAIETCPGRTSICEGLCYACSHMYCTDGVISSLQANYLETLRSTFVSKMSDELTKFSPLIVRIHTAGDFYSVGYVRKWIEICEFHRTIKFYAYTRSWRLSRFRSVLRQFAKLDNVNLWWSVDKETHRKKQRPPRVKGTRVAYLLTKKEERAGARIPAYVDLVFRYRPHGLVRYYDGRLVCPAEQDSGKKHHIGCSECKLCFTDRKIPSRERSSHGSQSSPVLAVLN